MSNIPLVRRAIAGAALAHSSTSNDVEPSPLGPENSQWTPAALERAGSTLKALNRMAKRPPVHIIFEDIGFTVGSRKVKLSNLNKVIYASLSKYFSQSNFKTGGYLHVSRVSLKNVM
ncbi:unnamed protein product [Euphydryas editha]|uniref:Uncharacterized protein n=1 Tax=Euphydryas editha TaxID=104508 RepID=A0AAU9V923_EUPED|nr:unnamed protein product [Euphydryas editha]